MQILKVEAAEGVQRSSQRDSRSHLNSPCWPEVLSNLSSSSFLYADRKGQGGRGGRSTRLSMARGATSAETERPAITVTITEVFPASVDGLCYLRITKSYLNVAPGADSEG